jgi:REP element-mobilizing transposase RayT
MSILTGCEPRSISLRAGSVSDGLKPSLTLPALIHHPCLLFAGDARKMMGDVDLRALVEAHSCMNSRPISSLSQLTGRGYTEGPRDLSTGTTMFGARPYFLRQPQLENARHTQLRQPEYILDEARQQVVLRTILEVAAHRKWKVWAAHVRTNHVHVVVSASAKVQKVMADFKAWASRRLREAFGEHADRDRWTQHGSTRYIWDEAALAKAIAYVLDEQGDPMARFDGRHESSEPEA